jgi:N4-gp56 family major capsid protein
MAVTSISAKQAAWVAKALLSTAKTQDIYGAVGEPPIPNRASVPAHNSTSALFRKYENLPTTPKVLAEGVTPDAALLTKTDITLPLTQFGDYVILSDISVDSVEDPLLSVTGERQGEQAINWLNQIRLGKIIAGTTIAYANGAQRTDVNTLISAVLIDKMARTLNLNKARKITKVLAATQGYNTMPIPATYVGFCSTYTCYDLKNTITESGGFTPAHKYANMKLIRENEYGAVGLVRFIEDPDMTSWADGGGAKGVGHKSTGGVKEDVFPTLIVGQEAYGILMFGGYSGKDGIKTYVETSGGTADPLHQRNTVGWKTMQGGGILNDNWIGRIEHGVTG